MTRSAYVWIPVLIAVTAGIELGGPLATKWFNAAYRGSFPDASESWHEFLRFFWQSLALASQGMQIAPLPLLAVWLAWGGSPLALRVLGFALAGGFLVVLQVPISDTTWMLPPSGVAFALAVVALMPPFRQGLYRVGSDGEPTGQPAFPWRFSIRQLLLVTAILAVATAGLRHVSIAWPSLVAASFLAAVALPVAPICWIVLRPQLSLWRSAVASAVAVPTTGLFVLLAYMEGDVLNETLTFLSDWHSYVWLSLHVGVVSCVWLLTLIVRQMGYRVARPAAIPSPPQT